MAKLFELPQLTPEQQAINRNIRDAFSLVDEGDQQLKVKEDQGLIIFGKSKSGKSTLANMLAGRELMATENAKGWQIVLTDPEMHSEGAAVASGRGSPVGNNIYRSETQIPHKSTVQGTAIIDVPGFFYIKGFSTDAAHSMLYARALKNTSNLKLVLAVAQNTIDSADAQYEPFINQITPFAKMFANNIEAIKGSIALVITKVDHGSNADKFSAIIKEILKDDPKLNSQEINPETALVKKVLEYVQDSVRVFHKPSCEGALKQELQLQDFDHIAFTTAHHAKSPASQVDADADATAMPAIPASPSSNIASSSFLTGTDAMFMDRYRGDAEVTLGQLRSDIDIINKMILDFFRDQLDLGRPDSNLKSMYKDTSFIHKSLLQKGEQNIFSKAYNNFTRELLPESYHETKYLYLKEKCTKGWFLKLHQTSRIIEALNPQKPTADINKLAEVLEILRSLTVEIDYTYQEDNPGAALKLGIDEQKDGDKVDAKASSVPLSEQIGGCLHILKRLVEFEEFCGKLCGAGQSTNLLTATLAECNKLVNNIFKSAINYLVEAPQKSGALDGGGEEYGYRLEAVEWLQKAANKDDPQTNKTEAHHYYSMGLICHKNGADENTAIAHYKKAISLNKELTEAHQNLGDLYFKQAHEYEVSALQYEMEAKVYAKTSQIKDLIFRIFNKPEPSKSAEASLFGVSQAGQIKNNSDQQLAQYAKFFDINEVSRCEHISKTQSQDAIKLYKAALDPLIKAGNLTKIETCFAKILSYNPYDAQTLEKQGEYYAGRHNIYDIGRALNAFECAIEQLKDDSVAKERIMQKAAKYFTSTFSSHPIFKDYEGSMIDVSLDRSAAATSFDIHIQQTFDSPIQSIHPTPAPAPRVLNHLSLDTSCAGSMDVSPSRSEMARPMRFDTPEPTDSAFLDISAAKSADMPLAGGLSTIAE